MKNQMAMQVVLAVVIAAAAFFGGMQYQKSQVGFGQGGQRGAGFAGRFGGNQNGQAVRGDIVNSDNNSLTIKMQDGSTKIVILSASTAITKAVAGSKSDLKTGQQVAVFGTNNSDGSITATIISLNPMFGRNMGGTSTPSK